MKNIKLHTVNDGLFIGPSIRFYTIFDKRRGKFVGPARFVKNPQYRGYRWDDLLFIKSNLYDFPPKLYQHKPNIQVYYDSYRDECGEWCSSENLVVLSCNTQNNFFVEK